MRANDRTQVSGRALRGDTSVRMPRTAVVSERVDEGRRLIAHAGVPVLAALKSDRVLAAVPASVLVVIPRPVLVDSGLRIELAGRVLVWVGERASRDV